MSIPFDVGVGTLLLWTNEMSYDAEQADRVMALEAEVLDLKAALEGERGNHERSRENAYLYFTAQLRLTGLHRAMPDIVNRWVRENLVDDEPTRPLDHDAIIDHLTAYMRDTIVCFDQ